MKKALDLTKGITEVKDEIKRFYPVEGGVYQNGIQIAGACDKPYRYKVGQLVRAKKISFKAALKQMVKIGVYGVSDDTRLRDI